MAAPPACRRRAPPRRRFRRAALLLAAALVCGAEAAAPAEATHPTDAERERFARHRLEDAHAFRRQGRLEAAERALRRGLAVEPGAADLERALARVLEELGREDEAAAHWSRANALDPLPPPPPAAPLVASAAGLLVLVVALEPAPEGPGRAPRDGVKGNVAAIVERRLAIRLPGATVVHAVAETVAAARDWIAGFAPRAVVSLRVDRADCEDTLKDGPFGLARLRVAAATGGEPLGEPRQVQAVVSYPRPWSRCEELAVAQALEQALALPAVQTALRAPASPPVSWSPAAVRALLPELGQRVADALAAGRRRLALGDLAGAGTDFDRAARIDPDDPEVRAHQEELEATVAMTRDLERGPDAPPPALEARLSPRTRAALEARLAEERARRDTLLAALAVLAEETEAPPREVLAALRPVAVGDPQAFAAALAASRTAGAIESRAAYAPDGSPLARYYFAAGAADPLLREEDVDGDGRPDRWVVYAGRARSEVWEDTHHAGRPDVHVIFAPGGDAVARIEFLAGEEGSTERIFHYAEGALVAEDRDTDGDGALDRFDRFDAEGRLRLRREDLDGDGRIDLSSEYRDGKLVRREVASPDFVPDAR
jgi:tetratricopeptide (TPR) repeat protein